MVRNVSGFSTLPAAISGSVGLLILAVLFIRRKTPTVEWAYALYLINTASVNIALLSTNLQFAVSVRNWEPFQASKLACLIAAMVAPGFRVGLLAILGHALGSFLQFVFFFPPEIKAQVADIEP
jgi:hypothetical protein